MVWTFVELLQPDVIEVTEAEAHHLLHVLRVRPQQSLVLFDGAGNVADAVVESTSRRSVFCRVLQRRSLLRTSHSRLTIAVSPPKGDRLRWMIEKLTELGVARITLLGCDRTVSEPGETRLEKLRSTAAAACKQSRQAWIPDLRPLTAFRELLSESLQLQRSIVIAHPLNENVSCDATANRALVATGVVAEGMAETGEKLLLIGPEGGFTDPEVASAIEAGARHLHWPGAILRTETAAIVFSTLLLSAEFRVD
jgi:16S rRNA (uracil1498-N3)-methyltransferase